MKIVILGAVDYRSRHKSAACIIKAMIGTLSNEIGDTQFTILCMDLEPSPTNSVPHGVMVLKGIRPFTWRLRGWLMMLFCFVWVSFHSLFDIKANMLVDLDRGRALKEYAEADVILIDGGDILSTLYGRQNMRELLYSIFLITLLNKPVVIYGHTIGPIRGRLNRFLASFVLNMTKLITVRDVFSYRYLCKMGVGKPQIQVTADPAFLLDPVENKRAREILLKENIDLNNGPLIGINISQLISRYGFVAFKSLEEKREKYVKIITETIDWITEVLNGTVVLVPHVFGTWGDDRIINGIVYQKVANKKKVKLVENEYTPEEMKGIIGQFDFFIASRMHPLIHAISMKVPSIGIDYDHKITALMKMLGLEKYVCHIKSLSFDELKSKTRSLYYERDVIRDELAHKIETMKERARLNARLVKNLLKEENIL